MGIKTDSGTLQTGVAMGAAMLTLQVSRQALPIGACLLVPRDCNFIRHVILHWSDTQRWFYGNPCPQHGHKTQNGRVKESSNNFGFSHKSKQKQKQKMRLWFSFKRAIWCVCLPVDWQQSLEPKHVLKWHKMPEICFCKHHFHHPKE